MESTERVTSRLTWPAIALSAATIALAAGLAILTDPPLAVPVVLFGALYFFAENIDLHLPSGAGLSGGFMIVIATIVVFTMQQAPLGVLLVGLCGGLYIPQLKSSRSASRTVSGASPPGSPHGEPVRTARSSATLAALAARSPAAARPPSSKGARSGPP